jgi:hypothetical protein
MATRYWFARSRRGNGYGRGVMPIAWQGWAVIAGFVACMLIGALSMLLIGLYTSVMGLGVAIYVILAIGGAGTFLWATMTKSDPDKSIAEYRADGRKKAESAT